MSDMSEQQKLAITIGFLDDFKEKLQTGEIHPNSVEWEQDIEPVWNGAGRPPVGYSYHGSRLTIRYYQRQKEKEVKLDGIWREQNG